MKKAISLIIISAIVLSMSVISVNAETVLKHQDFYNPSSYETKNNAYNVNWIIVVMTPEASAAKNEFTVDDFPELDLKKVRKIGYYDYDCFDGGNNSVLRLYFSEPSTDAVKEALIKLSDRSTVDIEYAGYDTDTKSMMTPTDFTELLNNYKALEYKPYELYYDALWISPPISLRFDSVDDFPELDLKSISPYNIYTNEYKIEFNNPSEETLIDALEKLSLRSTDDIKSVRLSLGTYWEFDEFIPQWYDDALYFVREHNLMKGRNVGGFAPDSNLTRAEAATVLWRLDGCKTELDASFPTFEELCTKYEDIKADGWYAEALRWAYFEGIMIGTSDTELSPNAYVTREQLATMIYRYSKDHAELPESSSPKKFADADLISDWAEAAVEFLSGEGLNVINGSEKNGALVFRPQNFITRAETAQMFTNYCQKFVSE
ncbi:MAG: S-layer homology domain-containing protein [Clostridia bacterium]|nr:S-layer homology domain-containing protein [Clostridia bacterium]